MLKQRYLHQRFNLQRSATLKQRVFQRRIEQR